MSIADPDWWRTASPLLDEVLELPEAARHAWFASLRRRDPELAERIEGLVNEHGALSRAGFLEQDLTPRLPAPFASGTTVGAYTLIAPIGEGGMGSVWLGERCDGEIQQRVAIKFVGGATHRPAWLERFLRERQLLASLDHPAIVRVIDAGRTAAGVPYLVMEYVEGSPIDVVAARLPIDERLRLFVQVCDAVWYAHRRLVIHRDLKPSNILVDPAGRPKLLDFGIARLLEGSLDAVDATQTVDRFLTPGYASPEQLRGAPQTTATDVYSLGAVLYKMLSGRSAHDASRPGADGPPSLPAMRKLNPALPADADYLVRKALRAEPEERYASVDALAQDVRALIDGRPVDARAGDVWYRTRKLARRHWVPLVAAALVVCALSTGLFVAERARAKADRRFEQLRRLAAQVISLDRSIRDLRGSEHARQELVTMMLGYLEGLRADAHGDVELMQELAEAYTHVAEVQGVPNALNLGEEAQAAGSLAKADALIAPVIRSRPTDPGALMDAATIAEERMILADTDHKPADALAFARTAAEDLGRLAKAGPPPSARAVATIDCNVALGFLNLHDYGESISLARAGAAIARTNQGATFVLGEALSLQASALRYEGRLEEALQAIETASAATARAAYPSEETRLFNEYGLLMRKASILGEDGGISLGRPADAARVYQQALDSMETLARTDPGEATSRVREADAAHRLGDVLRRSDAIRALATYDLALRRLGEIPDGVARRRDAALVLAASAAALRRLDRVAEGRRRIDRAMTLLTTTGDLPATRVSVDSNACEVLREAADQQADEGHLAAAAHSYEQLIATAQASKPDVTGDLRDALGLSRLYQGLADIYRREGAVDLAAATSRAQQDLWQPWARKLPGNAFIGREVAAARAR
jgi:tetratricopeptide (TPR) repeat protein